MIPAVPVDATEAESLSRFLRAYNDTLLIAEPILLDLWQSIGLTFAELRVLRWLRTRGPMAAGKLSEVTGIGAPSLARIFANLEDEGLIQRSVDADDRRRVEVAITPKGLVTLGGRGLLRGTIFEAASARLRRDVRDRLTADLNALRVALTEAAEQQGAAQVASAVRRKRPGARGQRASRNGVG